MVKVSLNIYDLIPSESKAQTLSKDALDVIGMGVHHGGIEVLGEEFSFGMDPTGRNDPNTDGIFIVAPRTACGVFKQQIELGDAPHITNRADIEKILVRLRPGWRAASYDLLGKNCLSFSRAFAEAIDPKLAAAFPPWVARIANVGDRVVPKALLQSITEAVAPPSAAAPDLIGVIFIPNSSGGMPMPLAPLGRPEKEEKPSGGLMGFAKGVASAVSSKVKSIADDSDRKDYAAAFPMGNPTSLLAAFGCKVLHINRVQKAKLYVTPDGLAVDGSNQLNLVIPWVDLGSLQFAHVVPPPKDHGNMPPAFEVIRCDSAGKPSIPPDGVLLYAKDAKRVFPFFDFTTFGAAIESTKKLTGAGVPAAVTALTACDEAWRSKTSM